MKAVSIKKLDRLCSEYIRTRDNWTCVRCGKRPTKQGLHWSHIFGRRYKIIRWDERNGVSHCFACHRWYGENPIEGGAWAIEYLGQNVVDDLIRLKNSNERIKPIQRIEIYENLKQKLERLCEQNA